MPLESLRWPSLPPHVRSPSLTTIAVANIDKAGQALAEDLPDGIPDTLTARAAHSNVPRTTLNHRTLRRRSLEEKAQSQLYLTPCEENAVINFVLHIDALGQPIRIKYIPAIAFSATRHRPQADRPPKPPSIN